MSDESAEEILEKMPEKKKRCTHNNSGTSATSTCTKLGKIIEISVLSSLTVSPLKL